ncbi:phosphoribosylformylglycinamidine synthase subunit PurQ [Neomoorella thermoacetica]|uniref:Phosphoribosylformylglycinamidine synthase subunit PurQ n=3 Tax=Neomoorella thermoacetica TaxID=1525 RepID=PURQ_MOOTA|nr:phosphoribosylformylglycinamidine synthase subunit PurQ [Moorella thermoacetica]Q2RGU4.1 RecName: Full=Phosphoribosylformylglycinamidine synthase subunit PurQ; Short=FGAM synthase; AltName: Full=Formylglycinamide ribonucleotide amidotransferase subunit I; Short=FGAR amidotransferase I; Short=FGAR-AT I; AltName: Full=Glutaminase PurQ; AltName: Full=Phosphoribosylformylglycinamidine synthase subunit I [Moorella thermoacetica ATCC 39073]AKX94880.1 phosphoribosylformylglycinamidine synthase 1 [Moo
MKFGVIVFPGSNCDQDVHYALGSVLGQNVDYLWHGDTSVSGYDCLILPGGFSYGDYLRAGAIARFAPIMPAVIDFARSGGLVLGICNGFQILLEAGLLPGAMMRNACLQFRCQWTCLKVDNNATPFTNRFREGQVVRIPIAHGEGNYYADAATLAQLEANRQIIFRYCSPDGEVTPAANPNGSVGNIAGIINREGNVLGMMPHPERCAEGILGGSDGRELLASIVDWWERGERLGA